ncbi:MAG: acetyl-CoA C-acyltransferase [Gammaproteobacteria bacterium]|nr:acetyl-CoA C-acyltransferase [Gammaproteobacteria bacterium]
MTDPIVIVSSARTPMGGFQGKLSSLTAGELGAAAIKGVVTRASKNGSMAHGGLEGRIGEVIMGNVLSAGQGQAPARQASLGAGLGLGTPCTTINKMCGSGMKSTMLAHDLLVAGTIQTAIAGGMESMSNAPYLLPQARAGQRMGHGKMLDHMFFDGLEDAYEKGTLMGAFAEKCADQYQFTRQQQDDFAISSLKRAQYAIENGLFKSEIAPVMVTDRSGEYVIDQDEQPFKARIDKIPSLKPAFRKNGTVTAANSSSISDGAAALLLMKESQAHQLGLRPEARILGHSTHAQEPGWFTTAPVKAVEKLLAKLQWEAADVDLYEINEAFAVVTMAAMTSLSLPHAKVNIHGGACALGHPIGASGARILVTLLSALKQHQLKRGVASLCIGGGEATAMAIEIHH